MTDYSAAQPAPGGGTFSVGAVIKRSFGTYFANFVPFSVLAMIFYLPSLLFGFSMDINVGVSVGGSGETMQEFPYTAEDGVGMVLGFVLTYILVGALVYGTVQYLNGSKAGLGEIVGRGFARIVPVVIIAILFTIGIAVGFALIIIPGVFLMVAWAVVIPASVVERPGIFGAFGRSWFLTKGFRWKILGLLLLMLVILVIITFSIGLLGGIVVFATGAATVLLIVNYIASAFSGALMSVMIAVLYHDLRVAKEGVSTAQIAAVFD